MQVTVVTSSIPSMPKRTALLIQQSTARKANIFRKAMNQKLAKLPVNTVTARAAEILACHNNPLR